MSYSPAIGTWLEKDPAGADYIDGANLYRAFGDNPSTLRDPSGLDTLPIVYTGDLKDTTPLQNRFWSKDYTTSWASHAGWSFSTLGRGPDLIVNPNVAVHDDSAWWISVGPVVCPSLWRIDGEIVTWRHTLLPSIYGGGNAEQINADVAKINAQVNAHENMIVQLLQEIWSPRFRTQGLLYQAQLDNEFRRRDVEFRAKVKATEGSELQIMNALIAQLATDEQQAS